MDYITVKETAELKGCSERYIRKLIGNGKIVSESIINVSNGHTCHSIPVSALPEDLQEKYCRKKRTEAGILPEKTDDKSNEKTPFKYRSKGTKKAFEEFSESERVEIKLWTDILTQWQAERTERKDKTEFDKLFVAHQKYVHPDLEISTDILYRKYSAYKNECYADVFLCFNSTTIFTFRKFFRLIFCILRVKFCILHVKLQRNEKRIS